MPIDNTQRATLTIAALTHLADKKRRMPTEDVAGMHNAELLERLVITGSMADRDQALLWFEKAQSFDGYW